MFIREKRSKGIDKSINPKTDKRDHDVLFSRSVIPDSVAVGVSNATTVSQADADIVIDSIINSEGSLLGKDHFVVVSTFD